MNLALNPMAAEQAKSILWTVLIGCMLSLFSLSGSATTMAPVTKICPIDGRAFQSLEVMSTSQMGLGLDFRPEGPSPGPMPLPICPDNGFVMYQDEFTAEELAKLRPYVASAEYQALIGKEAPYYRAYKLHATAGGKAPELAMLLLSATWESYDNPARYRRTALETLGLIEQVIQATHERAPEMTIYQLIAGELERRLERFRPAKKRFQALLTRLTPDEAVFKKVAEYQLELIGERDSQPHLMPNSDDTDPALSSQPTPYHYVDQSGQAVPAPMVFLANDGPWVSPSCLGNGRCQALEKLNGWHPARGETTLTGYCLQLGAIPRMLEAEGTEAMTVCEFPDASRIEGRALFYRYLDLRKKERDALIDQARQGCIFLHDDSSNPAQALEKLLSQDRRAIEAVYRQVFKEASRLAGDRPIKALVNVQGTAEAQRREMDRIATGIGAYLKMLTTQDTAPNFEATPAARDAFPPGTPTAQCRLKLTGP